MNITRKIHAFEGRMVKNAQAFRSAIDGGDRAGAAAMITASLGSLAVIGLSDQASNEEASALISSTTNRLDSVLEAINAGSLDVALRLYAYALNALPETHSLAGLLVDRGDDIPEETEGLLGSVAQAVSVLVR